MQYIDMNQLAASIQHHVNVMVKGTYIAPDIAPDCIVCAWKVCRVLEDAVDYFFFLGFEWDFDHRLAKQTIQSDVQSMEEGQDGILGGVIANRFEEMFQQFCGGGIPVNETTMKDCDRHSGRFGIIFDAIILTITQEGSRFADICKQLHDALPDAECQCGMTQLGALFS